jgi:3',5'-cyclic-AMP phosphodiesterase
MTSPTNSDREINGVDRRGFLKCMAWAGTGLLWTVGGGVLTSKTFGQASGQAMSGFSFAQISDSHIGFGKEPYIKSVRATLEEAVARINALP